MGVPRIPLSELYSPDAWSGFPSVDIQRRSTMDCIAIEDGRVARLESRDGVETADAYVSAVSFERLKTIAPGLGIDLSPFTHSPITGIHLWFDRPITELPNATLLDRTIQWMFNKEGGHHIQLVVSASRGLVNLSKQEVIDLAVKELAEFFPAAGQAELIRAHVVKEVRATFSAAPGLEEIRPLAATSVNNLFLAGDWTRSGWPATMEGAVRSGYLAAESVTRFFGQGQKFLV